jgi:hypothetical protein
MVLLSLFIIGSVTAEESNQQTDCLQKAIKRIEEIRMLPEKKYIHTLDGQQVELIQFFIQCCKNWPYCDLYTKFYYWKSEIKFISSESSLGPKKHKIRMYCNCLSTFCPNTVNPEKTHGDVAEYYDENGVFMGLSVYMGMGKYFSLPYSGYKYKPK